jgi:hypothetical protein
MEQQRQIAELPERRGARLAASRDCPQSVAVLEKCLRRLRACGVHQRGTHPGETQWHAGPRYRAVRHQASTR